MRVAGQHSRGSKIAIAVAVGVLLGCVFAFLYPDGFVKSTRSFGGSNSARLSQVCSNFFLLSCHVNKAVGGFGSVLLAI
jgi:hypothetical protein